MTFPAPGVFAYDTDDNLRRPSAELEAIGVVPVLSDRRWHAATLLNSPTYDGPAWAVWYDERYPNFARATFWDDRYPNANVTVQPRPDVPEPWEAFVPSTDIRRGQPNSMPKAGVAGTWGDFTVLGDVAWKANPSEPLSVNNSARFPHALWYSEPGKTDEWDDLEVEFMGQTRGDNRVVGMFPVEQGMLVATTSSIVMLRGTPDNHDQETVRQSVGPHHRNAVDWWPLPGVVVWVDQHGHVWQTNGEEWGRLDIPLPPQDGVDFGNRLAVGDQYLLVRRGGRTFALLVSDSGEGGWTELDVPAGTSWWHWRRAWWATVPGDGVRRFAPLLEERGLRDGEPDVVQRLASRTLSSGRGHERAVWHRFGLKLQGGRMEEASSRVGPWLTGGPSLVWPGPEMGDVRDLAVWPAHGPSREASFGWELSGDATVEGATVWVHQGRGER